MVKVTEKNPTIQKALKFVVDLGVAYEDDLIGSKDLADFFRNTMKVNDKKGNLGEDVTISVSKDKLTIVSSRSFSKRYIKYLLKKYLKKNDILDYLKVIATDKLTYRIKYIKLDNEEKDEQES